MIFKFNKVYIIESLSEDEIKTGKYLYEDLFHHNDVSNEYGFEYQSIKNTAGLNTILEIIYTEIKTKKLFPIIHFEMHGSAEGILLSSRDVIKWNDLAISLQKINIELKNKLVVVFALCHGLHFLKVFVDFINSRTPFAGLIASADLVKTGEIKNGFSLFYKKILETGNGSEAIKQLNNFIDEADRKYLYISCRWFFKETFIKYLELCSAKERNKRTEKIITKIKKSNPNVEITKIRKDIKQNLHKNNQKEIFITTRDKFLMYDLDASNKTLFNIDYQEVIKEI